MTEPATTPAAPEPARPRILALAMRFGPALLIAAAAVWVWSSGVVGHLTLDDLGRSRAALQAFVAGHPLESLLIYGAVYVAAVTLSLPAVLVLTLAGGFLFGTWEGGLAATLASAIGGVIIFLICRTALGGSLRRMAGPRVAKMHAAAHKDALGLMLTLRLVPMMPYWLINIGAAALDIPVRAFVIGALIGGLPSSVIYAALGAGLGRLFDSGQRPTTAAALRLALEPRMLLPLAALLALAIVPLAWRAWRARRAGAADSPAG